MQVTVHETEPYAYPDDLTPEIRATLAVLADVETRYEIERDRIQHTVALAEQARLVEDLEARRQVERGPLVQRLAELQQAMTFALMHRASARSERHTSSTFEVVVERAEGGWPSASAWSA